MKYRQPLLLLLGTALILFSLGSPLVAQTAPATDESAQPAVQSKTLLQQIQAGGWVMFPIALCSIATCYLMIDGMLRTSVRRIVPVTHERPLKDLFRQGDYMGAYQFCKTNKSPFTSVLKVGLSLLGDGQNAVEEGMMSELAKENSKLQTYISYLSVMGVCAPMIGLLGTVTGMIRAFATLGSAGIGDPTKLSSAIGEVLVATASGLIIAIPAFMAFYFLKNRAIGCIHFAQDILTSLFRKMPYETFFWHPHWG